MAEAGIGGVGDHFFVGLRPTAQLDARDRALLSDLRPAGVILYKSNFCHGEPYEVWLKAHANLIAEVRCAVGRRQMFIGIDHEGGRVCRTPAPITRFSYAAAWAGRADSVGRAMGIELASLGINLNFAPVLDIHSNPSNPVIGARAFGTDDGIVTSSALAFMTAMQEQGVLACGKHFPGHGDTDKDSHHALPVLHRDLRGLRARELKPFIAAIGAGVPMLMTSHILLPEIDPAQPVTLSKRFIDGLLRRELGYGGLVVSDDIGMRAVSSLFDDPTAAIRLLLAGCDMMMVCAHLTDTERCRGFAAAIAAAQANGAIPADLLARSKRRIHSLLAKAPQHGVVALPEAVFREHQRSGPLFSSATVEVV